MQQVRMKHNEAANGTVTIDWNDDDKTPSWKAYGEGSALLELTTNKQRHYLQVHATERGATSRTVMMTLDEPSAAAVVAKLAEMWGHQVMMAKCSNVLTDQIAAAAPSRNLFTNYYECTHEGRAQHGQPPTNWSDDSEAMNNDRCPVCNNEMEPVYSEDIETQQPAATAFRFALHLDLSAHDQPLTVIVSSLRDVAATVQSQALMFAQTRAIHDHNGHNIGQWEVIEPEPAPAPGTTALRAELAALDALRDATAAVADAAEALIASHDANIGKLGVSSGTYDARMALRNAITARKEARARAMASRPQSEAETVAAYDAANRATLKS